MNSKYRIIVILSVFMLLVVLSYVDMSNFLHVTEREYTKIIADNGTEFKVRYFEEKFPSRSYSISIYTTFNDSDIAFSGFGSIENDISIQYLFSHNDIMYYKIKNSDGNGKKERIFAYSEMEPPIIIQSDDFYMDCYSHITFLDEFSSEEELKECLKL